MDEPTTRKRVKTADPRLATRKKRLRPKSPSPLPESYSRLTEAQGAAALAVPALCPSLPHSTTSAGSNTCVVWGDPSNWGSAMPLESLHGWNHHHHHHHHHHHNHQNAVAATGFTTQDGDHFAISAPSADLTFPITGPSGVVGDSGNDGGSGGECGDSPPNKAFEKWQASTHGIAPLLPPSSAAFLSHPMSYTATDTHARAHAQSTDMMEPFSPGSDVADFHPGFTNTGFGVSGVSFDNPLVDAPGTPTFPHGKPHAPESDLLGPTPKFSAAYYHPVHATPVNSYFSDDAFRLFNNNGPWYEGGTSELPFDVAPISHLPPQSRLLLASEPRLEGGPELPAAAALGGAISSSPKLLVGGEKAERPRRPRGQLLPKDREETNKTRKWKACIRCRMQKIRCIPDPGKPETENCLCCRKVLVLETKKVIHRIPCLRWNLNEVALFRVGGLGLTKRWVGVCVENIPSSDWADERVITIGVSITTLLCDPIPLKVRRFKPNSTDVQHRYCKYTETEPPVLVTVPSYALADVDTTSEEYRGFVKQNAEEAIRRFAMDMTVNDYVRRTFSVALRHGARAAHKDVGKAKGDPAKLFRNYFRLWLASRFTLGSAYIVYGYENMEKKSHASMYSGKQFISRMITAQFDSIGYKHVLVKLKREVLDELWLLMQKRTDATFFTVYLIVFMMLHEVSIACQDRRRRAKEQGLKTYYDLEDATAKIKHGADIILGHWHYYKGDLDPLAMSEASLIRAFGADCIEEIRLMVATCQKYEEMRNIEKHSRTEADWEDPLYLVSQMFEPNWQPTMSCWP
ncbi:hypothetical protein F5Y10DRAFT_223576 [Nemania abortiva]|nr:hypothetical protein F5Y10DRAFT_223576 [Nemania abortiva]